MRLAQAWCALGLGALFACTGDHVEPLPARAQRFRARTGDGWELSLVRYPAAQAARGRPVLVCHGISANDRSTDLDEDHSLPRWLAAHGREAWTVSLRGTGDSDRPDVAKGRSPSWNFDTLWRQDLTTAIDHVRGRAAGEPIDLVAHSMGGMLAYAYLSQGGQGLNAVVTLASPTRLDWGGPMQLLEPYLENAVRPDTTLPVKTSAEWSVPLQGEFEGPVELLLYNPKNTSTRTWKRLVAMGTADIQGGVALQLASMVRTGKFSSGDGLLDYRSGMNAVLVPVLVVAGKADRTSIAPAVWDGYRALGNARWLLLSEENGEQADYGHLDYLTGERASTELWPRVLDFLDAHPDGGAASLASP